MRRVCTAVRMTASPPTPASSNVPSPSMKKGRFSSKNSGKRWLTSTWNASDSTWLKSGLTVPSTVADEVTPYFADTPTSGSELAGPKPLWLARLSCRE